MDTLKLTDDEVVALAVRVGAPWAAPTPTVDPEDATALAAAARRGERSLFARDLLAEDESEALGVLDPDLTALIGPALERAVLFAAYVGDDTMRWHASGLNAVYYRTADTGRCLAESVSSAGLHHFAEVERDIVIGSLRELARAALAGGVRTAPDLPPADSLCIVMVSDGGVDVLQLGQSTASLRSASDAQTAQPLDPATVDSFLTARA